MKVYIWHVCICTNKCILSFLLLVVACGFGGLDGLFCVMHPHSDYTVAFNLP